MADTSPDEATGRNKDFICGVVEGFYGRPWTTEQRKDLFHKLKKWGMTMYVYAPKDDYKHRAYWRELYTVEEAEHLASLIAAAREQGITFCYALSPGLDISYSSQKEITALKRKLEQVSQFGCTCFALLFDDIEPEMSEADKQMFQSFAHAQVSVTNEMHSHLGAPRFLVCPTQYCATRALPCVPASEYLNTLGSKLAPAIDIMWTGPKVISKTLSRECIEEVTAVLRRPPVIWDNLHANDYDQKRVFLGPYCGRSPELIPLLRGVLTNPNCEYNANMVPIRTLAHWAACTHLAADLHRHPHAIESVSWDIRLEREGGEEGDGTEGEGEGEGEGEAPLPLGNNIYHHRQALRHAINEWLPEFSIPKCASGPVIKPQPPVSVAPMPIVPLVGIVPMLNTCMSLGGTTTTGTTSTAPQSIPTVNTTHILNTTVTSAIVSPVESYSASSAPVMNSLVSPTKVVVNESIPNPIVGLASSNMSLPAELPISTLPVQLMGLRHLDSEEAGAAQPAPSHLPNGLDERLVNDSCLETSSFVEGGGAGAGAGADDSIVVDEPEPAGKEPANNGSMSVAGAAGEGAGAGGALRSPPTPAALGDDPDADVVMADNDRYSENGSMQVEPSTSPVSADMLVEPYDAADCACADEPGPASEGSEEVAAGDTGGALTAEDLALLCDLFYLPFEHGARALRLLHDFHWLTAHAHALLPTARAKQAPKPEAAEWRRRRCRFAWWCARARRLLRRLSLAANRELHCELHPYLWDVCSVLALLDGFVRWLELAKFPPTIANNAQGTYTWFSKGWREAFESGAQEPWVFRGGLTADLRRLLAVEWCGEPARAHPALPPLCVRPYTAADEPQLNEICLRAYRASADADDIPADLHSLVTDRLLAPFLTFCPELCMVVEEEGEEAGGAGGGAVLGYACAALDARELRRRLRLAWLPELRARYGTQLLQRADLGPYARECVEYFNGGEGAGGGGGGGAWAGASEGVCGAHPALVTHALAGALPERDVHAPARLLTVLLAALNAHGVKGVHTLVARSDRDQQLLYGKLGFVEVAAAAGDAAPAPAPAPAAPAAPDLLCLARPL